MGNVFGRRKKVPTGSRPIHLRNLTFSNLENIASLPEAQLLSSQRYPEEQQRFLSQIRTSTENFGEAGQNSEAIWAPRNENLASELRKASESQEKTQKQLETIIRLLEKQKATLDRLRGIRDGIPESPGLLSLISDSENSLVGGKKKRIRKGNPTPRKSAGKSAAKRVRKQTPEKPLQNF